MIFPCGEGEWKVKKHGTDGKRRVWRKLHLAVDTNTHEIIAAELTLSGVTDAEVLPNLLKQMPIHQGNLGSRLLGKRSST
ncbi:transposase [Vibrio diabolicus]|nr:transposase [Vibrio diabolicus]